MGLSFDFAMTAAVVIAIGLLFIDLVPLQETMRCTNYTDTEECPELYFSPSYQDAREKFLSAAAKAEAVVEHYLVLRRGNVEYYMDTAFVSGANPKKLLVHASGTHGIEGYTGSAIQTKLLTEWNESSAAGPSVLFIHAVNPYGMAHFRRFNEENVDLNRNYLTQEEWAVMKERDPNIAGYVTFNEVLNPSVPPRLIDRYLLFLKAGHMLVTHGYGKLKRAFVTGQYHEPTGVYYGGAAEQRSVTLLREILSKHAANGLDEAIFVDVHTGLGSTGVDTIMVRTVADETKGKKIFDGTRVQNDQLAADGPGGGYDLAAGLIHPIAELGPTTLAVTEEFGTVNPLFVARAVILENAAYHHCNGSYVHEVMRNWVRDAFYPQEIRYKQSALKRGSKAFWNSVKHLSD